MSRICLLSAIELFVRIQVSFTWWMVWYIHSNVPVGGLEPSRFGVFTSKYMLQWWSCHQEFEPKCDLVDPSKLFCDCGPWESGEGWWCVFTFINWTGNSANLQGVHGDCVSGPTLGDPDLHFLGVNFTHESLSRQSECYSTDWRQLMVWILKSNK